jgi:glycosyltransferase involved in cell wall biosynthesis
MPETSQLISVILPVYNAERYLRPCLEDILAQTHTNIELICIDDGSEDASLDILREYEARDGRVSVYAQQNAGAGAARNRGLALAQGSFLAFLDADDRFEPTMLAVAREACERHNADFCLFGSDQFEEDLSRRFKGVATVNHRLLPANTTAFSLADVREDHFRTMFGWAWDKLFRTDFVRREHLRFLEQHNSEDLYFVFNALLRARRITVVNRLLLHQRVGHGSSLSRSRAAYPLDFYHSLLALESDLREMGRYEELERSFVTYALHYAVWNLNTLPGKAFEKLYIMLKEEGFERLRITGREPDYFFERSDYLMYRKIRENEPIEYLQSELSRLRSQVDWLIHKVPFGLGLKAAAWYRARLLKNNPSD